MFIVILGFTILLATLFPIAGSLTQLVTGGMYGPIFGKFPPIYFHLIVLALSYIPMAIVAYLFVRKANLASRLPDPIPGRGALLTGIVLVVAYLAARLFASTVPGGGGSFVVMSFAPLVIIPANAFLVIGATKVLLSAGQDVS